GTEEQAWYGLLETHDALLRALDARLLAEHRMPLSVFEALTHITHAETGTISISDLADRVHLSPSQTSRVATGLEREGLARRRRIRTAQPPPVSATTSGARGSLPTPAPPSLSTIRPPLSDAPPDPDAPPLAPIWARPKPTQPPPGGHPRP